MIKSVIGFAGVSLVNGKFNLHTSTLKKIGVNIEAPGHAEFWLVTLPRGCGDKEAAIKFMLQHQDFQDAEVQKFLKSKLARNIQQVGNGNKQEALEKLKIHGV